MASKTRYLKITSTKKLVLPEGQDTVVTRFLLEEPYAWRDTMNDKLINDMTSEILEWKKTCHYSEEYLANICPDAVESSVLCAIVVSRPVWYEAAPTDPNAYHKLLLYSKFVDVLFEIDDFCEENEGKENHFEVVHFVGSLWSRISSLRYTSAEELFTDPNFEAIVSLKSTMGSPSLLFLDIMLEVRDTFGMTKENGKYYSDCIKNLFGVHAWSGPNYAYRYNSELQQFLRNTAGGVFIDLELIFLMEGLEVPGLIRENYYWQRCRFLAGVLLTKSNDIISIENEYKEQLRKGSPADNSVLLYMVSKNLTFSDSIQDVTRIVNLAVKEFQETFHFVKENPVIVSELTEDMKRTFYDSLEVIYKKASYCIQGQLYMKRYRTTWRSEIVEEIEITKE